MAIYHCSVKPISRGAGQSIVAAAAYRHGCRMEDKRTGEVHDYSRKRGVTVSAAFFPSDVDCSWATKSEILWNTAELAEKRKDARLGREIVLALPSELSPTERKALAAEMAQHVADRYGVAVDAAIHAPSRQGDDRNFHVHMLVSARRITSKGFGEKARELDDRERGPAEVEHLRAEWARLANRALEQAGQHVQIDHRSFRRQEVKRMPSRHLGASATALERRGIKTRIGDGNRAAARLNALAGQLEAEQAACVSLTEQAQRAAQEVRQYGVDLSREASSVSRPAMPRPTPQRAAEAPQRAMSSPSLVERAGAGPGSLHGAVERREGTAAAVRPEAARPTPQRAAEAPQRAMSSPSLVERAGAGPGSLHGAVERREGTAAAVRPEAARPTPQKGAEAPQPEKKTWINATIMDKPKIRQLGALWDKERCQWYAPAGIDLEPLRPWLAEPQKAVEAPQRPAVAQQQIVALDTLEGAKLLPRIEQAKKDQRAALEAVDLARRDRARAEWEFAVCRRDIEAHNAEFKEMGFLKRSLKCGDINRKATALEETYAKKAAALAETRKAEKKAEEAERHTTTALQKLQAAYVQTPHAKAVKEQERVKEEQEREARAARRERELKRALERDDEWER